MENPRGLGAGGEFRGGAIAPREEQPTDAEVSSLMRAHFFPTRFALSLVVGGTLAIACSGEKAERRETAPAAAPAAPVDTPVEAAASEGPVAEPSANASRSIRILLTTDEHGWIEPFLDRASGERKGGVVEAHKRFVEIEKLGEPNVVLLSAGDMWTGPYETTVLEGLPMLQAMNVMGYRAVSIGNHEFDFGTKTLEKRSAEAKFPFLAANLTDSATGTLPTWVKPSTIIDVGGVQLGILGLTNLHSPETTDPRHLVGLEFQDYAPVIDAEVPKLKAAGAEHIMVLLHDRISAAHALLPKLRSHGIHLIGVGHAHEPGLFVDQNGTPSDPSDDVIVCNAGPYLRSYCRVDLAFNGATLVERNATIQQISSPIADSATGLSAELEGIVADSRKRAEKIGGEILATTKRPLLRKDHALGQFVVDTWLEALPYAQVAVTNAGGIRQDLQKGPIRFRDVVSVLPFNNFLLVVDISGAELKQALSNPESVAAGVRYTYRDTPNGRIVLDVRRTDGKPIGEADRVKVVINDFMYRGGDRYTFRTWDSEPEETAIDWREPILRHLRALTRTNTALDRKADDRAKKVD